MLTPGPLLAAFLCVPRGTLRRWQHDGHITPRGHGARGVTLYDAREVITYAYRVGRTGFNPANLPETETP
jgi:hypothetical protein